jgi:pimeloyl-ACP methyl ester carboxylesterase
MTNVKKHGNSPYNVAVIHGGPGANGEVAPTARKLSAHFGVLEPFQTTMSLSDQVSELKSILEVYGNLPMTLIGHSYGAWLIFILAAKHPSLVKKIILVGSVPFETKYAEKIMAVRLSRLSEDEQSEMQNWIKCSNEDINAIQKIVKLFSKADNYRPVINVEGDHKVEFKSEVYQSVWPQAAELRRSGELLKLGQKIKCPVVAIHGDYDPHPAEGVKEPLSKNVTNFKFILLNNCGHSPWIEELARDKFYEILITSTKN